MEPVVLETPRLYLRQWCPEDLEPFVQMSADPEVMRNFPSVLTREQSIALVQRFSGLIEQQGWGFWALEEKQSGVFVGLTGLHHQSEQFSFSPCTEVAWRLSRPFWGLGYASEAAKACFEFAFDSLHLDEVVAFTAQINHRSQSVMQRLGMAYRGMFDHPAVSAESPLCRHVLYAITRAEFEPNR